MHTPHAPLLVVLAWSVLASPAHADPASGDRLQFDLEADPLAYLAAGSSLHLGLRWQRLRLDLGAFSADIPHLVHGQSDFSDRFHGWGIKLDVALREDGAGPFVGVEASLLVDDLVDERTDLHARSRSVTAGLRAGWRFELPARFYLVPWLGVGLRGGERDVQVGERTFERGPWTVFPTIHVGYRFP